MSALLLIAGRLALLGLLYLFLWRVVRVVAADLRDPVSEPANRPAPRPAVAQPQRAPTRHPPASLVIHPEHGVPRPVELAGLPLVFGRAEGVDHVLDDTYVSDQHAEITPTADGWQVRDLGSTNGTYLNGRKLIAPTALAAGDQLQLGKTRIEVRR